MLEAARTSLVQGAVAFVVVAGLLRTWRIRGPVLRLRLELLVLVAPTAGHLLLAALPFRHSPSFVYERALLRTEAWEDVQPLGVRLDHVVLAIGCALAVPLLGRDLVASLRRPPHVDSADAPEAWARVRERLGVVLRPGQTPPALRVLATSEPILSCRGIFDPTLHVSSGALALSDAELDAALAHELAHLRHRDPRTTWLILSLRALAFWNPLAQVAGRRAAWELERRADAEAVAWCGAEPLAAALDRLDAHRRIEAPSEDEGPLPLVAAAATAITVMAVVV